MTDLIEHHRHNCQNQNHDSGHGLASISVAEVLQVKGLSQYRGVVISTGHRKDDVEDLHDHDDDRDEDDDSDEDDGGD